MPQFFFILGGAIVRGSSGTRLGHVFVGTAMTGLQDQDVGMIGQWCNRYLSGVPTGTMLNHGELSAVRLYLGNRVKKQSLPKAPCQGRRTSRCLDGMWELRPSSLHD